MITHVLTLFGTFELTCAGTPIIHFHSDKVRALLAYLATESDRPHTRAALAAVLWPEQGEAAARRNLSQTLVRLRDVLGDTGPSSLHLDINQQTIQWRSTAAAVDAADFVRLARSADPADLTRAVALYRGEFLAGFGLRGCEPFEEWMLLRREQFQQQVLASANRLAEHHLAAQQWAEAAGAAQRQIELDRWREHAHRQLMRAWSGAGDRAAALAAYERCVQILHDDLAITPDSETTALANAIRAGETAASTLGSAQWVMDPRSPVRQSTLPAPLSPLVGRADELATIRTLLISRDYRLVTITGIGGAGKTRLALAVGWALRDDFRDGVGWASLAGVVPGPARDGQIDALATSIGAALGVVFDGRIPPLDELCRAVQRRAQLLILDNCEQLPALAAVVQALLTAAPRLCVLATSRARLDLAGEALVRLDGLPLPLSDEDDPAAYASVRLFLDQAQRHVASFGRDAAELPAVVRLCRLLDGLPLGIELAARWVGHYTCDEIAAEIAADLDFLAVHGSPGADRHHSIRAAFAYSWGMLRAPERQALARLAVFRGSFDRVAAQAITEMGITTLAALVDSSLVRPTGVGRYDLHELLRQFAATHLAAREEADALAERHATYYLELLARHEPLLAGPSPPAAAAVVRAAVDNLRQAWSWAVAHGAWALIASSLGALRHYVVLDGLFHEHGPWVADAAARLAELVTTGTIEHGQRVLLGRLRGTHAHFLERQEAREAAARTARLALAEAGAAGDAVGVAYAQLQLTNATVPYIASLAADAAARAVGPLEQAVALCRAAPRPPLHEQRFASEVEADSLLKLSTIYVELRQYAAACTLAEQALALTQARGARLQEARAHSVLAMALENAGRFEAAYERRILMLELAQANGSRAQIHRALNNVACTLLYLGDYQPALEYGQAAIDALGAWTRSPYENTNAYHTLSWVACRAGAGALALDAARQALTYAHAMGSSQHRSLPLLALGDACFALGHTGEALAAYDELLALARAQHNPQPLVVALVGIARCRLAEDGMSDARVAVDEVLRITDWGTLGCLWEPLRVAATCYEVLRAVDDRRADDVLRDAAALLEQQSRGIADPERRRRFREQVAAHRTLLAAAAQVRLGASP